MLLEPHILRPTQNGRHFPDDIFECIFWNENVWTSIKISLKFAPKGPINSIPLLVQIMARCRSAKPLSEPMVFDIHIDAHMRQSASMSCCNDQHYIGIRCIGIVLGGAFYYNLKFQDEGVNFVLRCECITIDDKYNALCELVWVIKLKAVTKFLSFHPFSVLQMWEFVLTPFGFYILSQIIHDVYHTFPWWHSCAASLSMRHLSNRKHKNYQSNALVQSVIFLLFPSTDYMNHRFILNRFADDTTAYFNSISPLTNHHIYTL